MRDGTVPHGPALLADERTNMVTADIAIGGRRGGRRDVRPDPAGRRQRPGLPRPRRQRRALRAAVPDRGRSGCSVPAARWSSGRPTRRRELEATLRRGLRQRRDARATTSGCRSATSSTGSTSRGYRPLHERPDEYPHRARLHGRGPGARRRAVAGPDPARGGELPDQRHHDGARPDPGAGPGQGRGRRRQRRARRAATREQADGDRRRGPRASRRASTTTHFPIDVFQTGSGHQLPT